MGQVLGPTLGSETRLCPLGATAQTKGPPIASALEFYEGVCNERGGGTEPGQSLLSEGRRGSWNQ